MSDTQEAEVQTNSAAPPTQEAPAEEQQNNEEGQVLNGEYSPSTPGYKPVDTSHLDPDTQRALDDRFKYYHRQVKDNQRTLKEYRQIAEMQAQKIQELTSGVVNVVNHLEEKSLTDNESQLIEMRRLAWEKGDSKSYDEINDKLIDIKLKKQLRQNKPAPQQQVQQPQAQYANAEDLARAGFDDGELTDHDVRHIKAWMSETDDSGELLRPWAADRNHPVAMAALNEAMAVWRNPRFATTQAKVAEIDRRMGVAKRTVSQSVMGANLTNARKSPKVSLTPTQEKIALRMGGSKKSDADKLSWYRDQVAKANNKGARK